MAYVDFHRAAPTGFLIVADGWEYDDMTERQRERHSVLVQVDYDYPGVASRMGWSPCHDGTDGTINCPTCGRTASDMIAGAFEHILAHEGEVFAGLDDYFS